MASGRPLARLGYQLESCLGGSGAVPLPLLQPQPVWLMISQRPRVEGETLLAWLVPKAWADASAEGTRPLCRSLPVHVQYRIPLKNTEILYKYLEAFTLQRYVHTGLARKLTSPHKHTW